MLALPKCMGIKIHPEEHGYPIARYGRAIFEFAARRQVIIQSHSGEKNSLPADFVKLANDFPQVQLIISHLGCGWDGDLTHQVRAIQQSKHGNVYTDTSSAKSITSNLLEWAVDDLTVDLMRSDEFFQDDVFDLSGGHGDSKPLLERAHERVEQLVAGYQSRVPGDIQEALRRHFHDLYRRMG